MTELRHANTRRVDTEAAVTNRHSAQLTRRKSFPRRPFQCEKTTARQFIPRPEPLQHKFGCSAGERNGTALSQVTAIETNIGFAILHEHTAIRNGNSLVETEHRVISEGTQRSVIDRAHE